MLRTDVMISGTTKHDSSLRSHPDSNYGYGYRLYQITICGQGPLSCNSYYARTSSALSIIPTTSPSLLPFHAFLLSYCSLSCILPSLSPPSHFLSIFPIPFPFSSSALSYQLVLSTVYSLPNVILVDDTVRGRSTSVSI